MAVMVNMQASMAVTNLRMRDDIPSLLDPGMVQRRVPAPSGRSLLVERGAD